MIARIRDRLIYADPSQQTTQYEVERRRMQQQAHDSAVRDKNLIPSISGPPPKIFGQHLPTQPEEDMNEKKKKKKEKGVWYPPWYDMEEEEGGEEGEEKGGGNAYMSRHDLLAVEYMDEALRSLSDPTIMWDTEVKKGAKSRAHFEEYMLAVGVGMWRQCKEGEDDSFSFSSKGKVSRAISGKGRGGKRPTSSLSAGGGSASNRDGASLGGPANSANTLGRGGRRRGGGRGA
jgi:hypothetical protein